MTKVKSTYYHHNNGWTGNNIQRYKKRKKKQTYTYMTVILTKKEKTFNFFVIVFFYQWNNKGSAPFFSVGLSAFMDGTRVTYMDGMGKFVCVTNKEKNNKFGNVCHTI